jgi:GMP synthase (glutamine-hydrolysing)
MNRPRLLIVKTGSAIAAARERFGDFDAWFRHAIGPDRFDYETLEVSDGAPPPDDAGLDAYAGLVVTGSPAMVSHRLEWSERCARWLAGVVEADHLPVLGVCYGHQLLAHGLGGRVGPNPRGRRMGTQRLRVSDQDDRILGGLHPEATVQVTHLEVVLEPPPGARLLGTTEADPYHALHFGGRSWGVQFHPEFDAAIMRCYVEARADLLEGEGHDSRAILEAVDDADTGREVLARFADICDNAGGREHGQGR